MQIFGYTLSDFPNNCPYTLINEGVKGAMYLKSLDKYKLLIILLSTSNSLAQSPHNPDQNGFSTLEHFRRQGEVQFENKTVDREVIRKRVDVTKINAMLEEKRLANEKAAKNFFQIPKLSACLDNDTIMDRKRFVPSPKSNFHVDMLVYDASDMHDRASSEIWPRRTVAYDPENPSHLMRFGVFLGLTCLPTRILTTERGLELRTGESAWKISNKETFQDKTLRKELQLLRKETKKKRF